MYMYLTHMDYLVMDRMCTVRVDLTYTVFDEGCRVAWTVHLLLELCEYIYIYMYMYMYNMYIYMYMYNHVCVLITTLPPYFPFALMNSLFRLYRPMIEKKKEKSKERGRDRGRNRSRERDRDRSRDGDRDRTLDKTKEKRDSERYVHVHVQVYRPFSFV